MEVNSEEDIDDIIAKGPGLEGKPEFEGNLRFVGRPVAKLEQEHVIRNTIMQKDPVLDYPKIGDTVYSEWDTPWLGSMCFPHLFPGGYADPWAPDRKETVTLQKAAQHLLHFRHKYDNKDEYFYPFAEDKLFICWIGNVIARHKTINQVGIYMSKHEKDKNLTREQLEVMAQTWKFESLIKRVGSYVSNVSMTPEYWGRQRRNLNSLQEAEGFFDSFLTWSYCNLYDPYLHRLYHHPSHTGQLTMAMRAKVKKKVPHLVTAFITERMDVIRDHYVFGIMNAKIFWGREEWQARGEKHRHGLAKNNMALNHRENGEIAAVGKMAALTLKSGDYEAADKNKLLQQEKDGIVAEAKVIRAVDLLVTCMHPDVKSLESVWTLPDPHPCTRAYATVLRDFDKESRFNHEKDLWNVAGRHRKCNSYCLRKGKCRFHFGDDSFKPLTPETKVVYDIKYPKDSEGADDKSKAPTRVTLRVVLRRNDKFTVDINKPMFFGNGFNSVYMVVVDGKAAKNYASKYSSKPPVQSSQFKAAISNILKYAKPDATSQSCVIKSILKAHGRLDRSPAEWCHFINSLRTCETKYRYPDGTIGNYRMINVNLTGGKRINMDAQNEDDVRKPTDVVTMDSNVDAYARRKREKSWCAKYPEIKRYNLMEFTTEFGFFAEMNIIQKLTTKVYVNFYPKGCSNYKVCVCVCVCVCVMAMSVPIVNDTYTHQ